MVVLILIVNIKKIQMYFYLMIFLIILFLQEVEVDSNLKINHILFIWLFFKKKCCVLINIALNLKIELFFDFLVFKKFKITRLIFFRFFVKFLVLCFSLFISFFFFYFYFICYFFAVKNFL